MAVKAGTAYVDIEGDFTPLEREVTRKTAKSLGEGHIDVDGDFKALDAELAAVQARFKAIGKDAGKGIGDRFDGAGRQAAGFEAAVTKATKATDLWQDSQGRWRSASGRFASDAEKVAAGINGVTRSARSGSGGIDAINRTVTDLGGGFGKLALGAIAVAPPLLALGGAAFSVGAALAPLVGLGPAAAVGLSAIGQAAGVAALASIGVGDALKEQLDATSKTAAASLTGANQQRAAARAITQAQEGVRAAHERVRDATEALTRAEDARLDAVNALGPAQTKARRDLDDLHAALTRAALGQENATQGLASAQQELAQAMNPQDPLKFAAAQDTLTQSTRNEDKAARDLADARERLADLYKPADALTVADVTDAVADATRGQTRAANDLVKAQARSAALDKDPAATDQDRADAKLALADAENAIGDASRQSAHAQETLNKLQSGPDPKDVAKAKQSVADAEQGVADATTATAKAQKDLQDAQKGADPDAVAAATLKVADAEQALADATRDRARLQKDVTAADKAGINGSDGVVAARDRIAAADRGVVEAERQLHAANRDVTKSIQAVADAQADAATGAVGLATANDHLNEKFDALPPAAQAFVRTLQDLKPRLDDVRGVAAAGLFPGVTAGIASAMKNFEPLKRVVAATALVLGDLATRAGELIGSKGFGKDLETIGGRNATIIDRIGRAALYLADGFKDLLVAAGPLATWLAKVTVEWSKNAGEAIKAGRESGALGDFFQKTRNTLVRVVSILGNLGKAFFNVGKEAAPFGRDLLANIDKVTGKFADWTASIDGQNALQDFFKQSRDLANELFPVIGAVVKSLGEMAFRVLPAYLEILKAVGPLAGPLLQTFIALKLAASAAGAIGTIATLANPVGLVVGAIIALGAGFVIAYKRSERFREVVDAAWDSVKKATKAAVAYVKGWLSEHSEDVDRVGDAFNNLAKAAVWVFEKVIVPVVRRAFPVLKGIIEGGLQIIGGIIKTVSALLTGDWSAAWDGLKDIVQGAFNGIVAVLTGSLGLLWDAAKALGEGIWGGLKLGLALLADVFTAPFKAAWNELLAFFGVHSPSTLFAELGGNLVAGLVNGLKAGVSALLDAAKWIGDKLVAGVKAYVTAYKDLGGWLLDRIVNGFKAVTSGVDGAAKWLLETVKVALEDLSAFFGNRGKDVLGWIVSGITTVSTALTGVGDWLVAQLKAGFEASTAFFGNRGKDVLGWIVSGITTVTDDLTGVGGWLVKELKTAFSSVEKGFTDVGGTIIGWIISGLSTGAFELQGFLNKILHVVNKVPGVEIPDITVLKKDKDGKVTGLARGGAFARTGGYVDSPITLMGEEAPRHPEFVIPTNPAYRKRAQELAFQAARAVGLAAGGVYTASKFGGHDDPSAFGHRTASGAIANDSLWGFAELSNPPGSLNFAALGKLAMGTKIDIGYGGKTAKDVPKVDVGAGGPGIGGHIRAVDMTYAVAQALGFPGLGNITVNAKDGGGGILNKIGGAVSDAASGAFDILKDGAGLLLKQLPSPDGLGWLKGLGERVLGDVTSWIKHKALGVLGSGGGSSTPTGVAGLGTFDGRQVAKWIVPELEYARNHGWTGHITSGWRSQAQQDAIRAADPRAATVSEHLGTQYPHGAIDFGGFVDAAGLANKQAFMAATAGYRGLKLLPAQGFRDDGHMSGTGHYKGGVYGGGLLGSYETGTPFVPQTGPYLLHRGEAVTPAAANQVPPVVEVYIGGERIDERIEVRIRNHDRALDAAYGAGVA